jgi:hypothetical protein
MSPKDLQKEISRLTADLISASLSVDQNFPTLSTEAGVTNIGFGATEDLSITLKNIPYSEAYGILKEKRAYNIKFPDGAVMQLLYRYRGDDLVKHRLAFFPSPDLLQYQNDPEVYEEDVLFAEVVDRNVVTVPIRFDFDPGSSIDYDHPASHLTIGQYKNCRVPVSGPLTPYTFVNFILRAFYNTPHKSFCNEMMEGPLEIVTTITDRERRHMHLRLSDIS